MVLAGEQPLTVDDPVSGNFWLYATAMIEGITDHAGTGTRTDSSSHRAVCSDPAFGYLPDDGINGLVDIVFIALFFHFGCGQRVSGCVWAPVHLYNCTGN